MLTFSAKWGQRCYALFFIQLSLVFLIGLRHREYVPPWQRLWPWETLCVSDCFFPKEQLSATAILSPRHGDWLTMVLQRSVSVVKLKAVWLCHSLTARILGTISFICFKGHLQGVEKMSHPELSVWRLRVLQCCMMPGVEPTTEMTWLKMARVSRIRNLNMKLFLIFAILWREPSRMND